MEMINCIGCKDCKVYVQSFRAREYRCGFDHTKDFLHLPLIDFTDDYPIRKIEAPIWCPKRREKVHHELGDKAMLNDVVIYYKDTLQQQHPSWEIVDVLSFIEGVQKGIFTSTNGYGYFMDTEGIMYDSVRCDIEWLCSHKYTYLLVAWHDFQRGEKE